MVIEVNTPAKGVRWLAIMVICACCATCTTTQAPNTNRSKAYISEKVYGVKANPVAYHKNVAKGGGRYVVGKPYVVKGKSYFPKEDPNYDMKGVASWYGSAFRGRRTANGEDYDPKHLSAAHPTLPLPSYVRVTNLENGSSLILRVNDRGPYRKGRIIDVSSKAADMLDLKHRGTASVRVQYVGRARLGGDDMPYLLASYLKKRDGFPAVNPEPQITTGVMVASDRSIGDPLRSDSQSFSPTRTNFAGTTRSASYQTGTNSAVTSQTSNQLAMLRETGHLNSDWLSEYTPSMSRSAKIAPQTHEIRSLTGFGVKYCLDEDGDDGLRDMCGVQVLPLAAGSGTKRLTGIFSIRRRRSCQRDGRWWGTTLGLT
ncbi:septal ring lytic transglycosylase RlpA family protein (plasmid) [Ensifer adhaerens]|uniref:septal ring lytic transglycosylase RlpA family protein n=1 Tax=Ensifer adhaerens TaxID=106592 RepID=UPI0023A923C7|nr:septal ring lytic transglycosylase RlpA family protein [Ensifer adhaerens]WDZ81905.1 septal ring lytic transglycosylase RlpA family protein [Ensifer adhaerens]